MRVLPGAALTNVLFPHLSRIQHDEARLHRAYLSVLALGGVLVFPVCAGMAVAAHELVLVVLGRQWSVAATTVPWFALAAGCSVISALSQTVAEARADLYRSLGVQAAYIVVLAGFLVVAVANRSHGIWVYRCGGRRRGSRPPCRLPLRDAARRRGHHGRGVDLVRARSSPARAWRVAIAAVRHAVASTTPTLVTFAAEVAAGAAALLLCIRFCPLPAIRRELRLRLSAAGALGGVSSLRWRLAPLVLGQPEPRP